MLVVGVREGKCVMLSVVEDPMIVEGPTIVEGATVGFDDSGPPGVTTGEIGDVVAGLRELVTVGVTVSSVAHAKEQLDLYEQISRLAEAGQVQVLGAVDASGVYVEHGHYSATVMQRHQTQSSSATATARDKTRRMLNQCDQIAEVFFDGKIGVDHIRVLARAFSNPRTVDAFIQQQHRFIQWAERLACKRFEARVANWVRTNDFDGPEPNDRAHENRDAKLTQDHFSEAWQLRGTSSSAVGAEQREILDAYIEAEFHKDWEAAKAVFGDDVCVDKLARKPAQRRADALHQIFLDAAANPNSSARGKTVHNIVWTAETYAEMLRRFAGAEPTPFDLDTYRCSTVDGDPINPAEAFIDSLTSQIRRIVIDARGVVIDMGEARFLTGLARLAMQISNDECCWPGCHLPTTACQADHILAHTKGGQTDQHNMVPCCAFHNRTKERGYTVWRDTNTGEIHIVTPGGEQIQ